jgi:hypothetical protein
MALPKKGLRTITVKHKKFGWISTGTDGGVYIVVVALPQQNGRKLIWGTGYYYTPPEPDFNAQGKQIGVGYKNLTTITPYVVRQVIEHALEQGWKPGETATDPFYLHKDTVIDLRLPDGVIFRI